MNWRRVVLILVNLILLNLLLIRSGCQWDVTQEKLHTLSPEIPKLLQALPTKARVLFVSSSNQQWAPLKPLVSQIRDRLLHFKEVSQGQLEVEFIDPYKDEQKRSYVENHFGVTRFPAQTADGGRALVYFSVVVEVGAQSEVLTQSLVRPQADGQMSLNNFEALIIRSLNKLSGRYQTLHQALIQLEASGSMRLMPIVSENLDKNFVGSKILLEGVLDDLIKLYPKTFRREPALLNDEKYLEKLNQAGLKPWTFKDQNPFYFHLMLIKADGASLEVPNLLSLNTARAMRQWIEQYLLLLLDLKGRQLGLLIPETRPQASNGYEHIQFGLSQSFQVSRLKSPLRVIPPGIGTLLVMGIPQVDTQAIREIDKFVMRGGNLILFVDRHELSMQSGEARLVSVPSGFEGLLESWGVKLGPAVGAGLGVPMAWPRQVVQNRRARFEYPVMRSVHTPVLEFDRRDFVPLPLKGLEGIVLSHPNALTLGQTRSLKVEKLLEGGEGSWASTVDSVNPFDALGQPLAVEKKPGAIERPFYGVLLEGSFPHYQIPGVTEDFVRPQSPPVRVALVADGDFADMNFWVPPWRGIPTQELNARLNQNMLFLRNLVDWAFGDDAILQVSSNVARHRNLKPESKSAPEKTQHVFQAFGIPIGLLLLIGLWRFKAKRRLS